MLTVGGQLETDQAKSLRAVLTLRKETHCQVIWAPWGTGPGGKRP